MAMKAFGRYVGNSLTGIDATPHVAARREHAAVDAERSGSTADVSGTSSDWIGGRCAPTHTTAPIAAITIHSDSTAPQ